jgi:Ser/Thr protein kinase RdoA (MazF antagonist)
MGSARNAGLDFVPRLESARDGTTRVEHEGRWWELAEWRQGCADFRDHPTSARLEAACIALARLHLVWQDGQANVAESCPAIVRRDAVLRSWHELCRSGWQPLARCTADDPLRPLVERTWPIVLRWLNRVPSWLASVRGSRRPVQPCLCDVWHDNLLFDGDHLTGLVDYGSVKADHVAVDVARLLGSLIEDDESQWHIGFSAYRSIRPLSDDDEALARVLDRTGTILGIMNWLRWLYADGRVFEDRMAVRRRLEMLVARVERW